MTSHPKGKQPKTGGKHPHGPLTRSGEQAQIWDDIIGPSISVIPGHQLPQVKTVLQRYRSLRIENPKEKIYTLASHIAEEVTAIWTRGRIPTIAPQNVTNKVVQAVEWWNSKHDTEPRCKEYTRKLLDIAPKLRGKASEDSQLDHLKNLMRQSCSMQRRKSEGDKYDWEVDFQFYVDQAKGDRVQTLGVADGKLYQTERASEEVENKRAKYFERQANEASTSQSSHASSTEPDAACDSSQTDTEADDDDEYQPPPQPLSQDITLTLPRRGLLSGTADLATRCKISHRKALAITAKLVKMGGGQLDQCSLSASTSLRQRTAAIAESESNIKSEFASSMPSHIVLHWDGKVIKYENRKESDERLAIVLSSPQLECHTQFLAAPRIPDGTGASMKDALMTTLNVWDIPDNSIIGMCWDTTASNTGRRQGSATLFEQELGRGIMWLSCRHHIGELHIKHADVEVRGAWAGPTDRLFEQFRERFPQIQVDPLQLKLWDWPEVSRPHTFLVARALDVRDFLEQHLLEDDFGRDDYRELCELIIKFLGGHVIRSKRRPGALRDDFVMRAPGALHHARFLASCLYIMKLVMLSNVTPRGLLTPNMLAKLERMAQYISLFHGPWFLQARVVAIAPRLDFELWEQMGTYQNIDAPIARAVRQSLLRHLWYLTEHLVIFAFFDESVVPDVKEVMATQLHNTPRPQNFGTGKPDFPTGLITANPTMDQFIGPKSWLLFHLLGANGAWLTMPPDQWSTNQEYNDMRDIVTKLEVVNDVAEGGVKDIQDYADAARDGAYRERIILVSNSHRIKLPGFSKNEMEEGL